MRRSKSAWVHTLSVGCTAPAFVRVGGRQAVLGIRWRRAKDTDRNQRRKHVHAINPFLPWGVQNMLPSSARHVQATHEHRGPGGLTLAETLKVTKFGSIFGSRTGIVRSRTGIVRLSRGSRGLLVGFFFALNDILLRWAMPATALRDSGRKRVVSSSAVAAYDILAAAQRRTASINSGDAAGPRGVRTTSVEPVIPA